MGAPTPAPGGWNAGGPSSRGAASIQTKLVAGVQLHMMQDPASGESFDDGLYDGQSGWTLEVSPDGNYAEVQLDEGPKLSNVPRGHIRPQHPQQRGAMCFVLGGPHAGARVTVSSIDGDDIMTQNSSGESVFGPREMFALCS